MLACYLRDRDFDYEPPIDTTQPVVDQRVGAEILGWHWCRHEIESYLIDPALVLAATGWDRAGYAEALVAAGEQIRHYQSARWVVGTARRSLPPHHELSTRPDGLEGDFRLPQALDDPLTHDWARQHLSAFLTRVENSLGAAAVEQSIASRSGLLTEARFDDVSEVLLWCSGKDLLAALEPWLNARGHPNAGAFRAFRRRMRNWVIENPDAALACLPERQALVQFLRQ